NESEKIAEVFSKTFEISSKSILNNLNKNSRFVWLARNVDFKKSEFIDSFAFRGLIKFENYKRLYPYSSTASQTIGFTDIDNNGLSGIEKLYNKTLSGIKGKLIRERHNTKKGIPETDIPVQNPINGKNIQLTIDLDYQIILEEELEKVIDKHNAKGGTAIIMNPNTGEILAMASYPTFDANHFTQYNDYNRKNRAITDIYEPGSTFKIVMASAVLENKIVKPTDVIFCENGSYRVYNKKFTDHKEYGYLTFREVIEHSSNIGAIKTTEELDNTQLFKYVRNFGFGNETGVGLIGEAKGILHPVKKWSGISKAEISIGYEVGVTPIQLINAYCAVANGGVLLKPSIVKQIVDDDNNIIYKSKPKVIRRVISRKTSRTILNFLEDVVGSGTGVNANIDGLKIAGKTGTAQKISEDGKHSKSDYFASFVGIYPSDNPQLVTLVMIDSPQGGEYYGSLVAAPTFKKILNEVLKLPAKELKLQYVNKDLLKSSNSSASVKIPDLRAMTVDKAEKLAKKLGINIKISGTGNYVIGQSPIPGELIRKKGTINLTVNKELKYKDNVTVPDLRGMNIRTALNMLAANHLEFEIEGTGKVISQTPKENTKTGLKTVVKLICGNYK
ncbi:penicillin-binding transpeptidase domain-containing protein, partial [candidate division KSB1 bacterium]